MHEKDMKGFYNKNKLIIFFESLTIFNFSELYQVLEIMIEYNIEYLQLK